MAECPRVPSPAPRIFERRHGLAPLMLSALLYCVLGASPALAAPSEVAFENGFPKTSRDRIFPLSEIRRGQTGVGYTVFGADKAEPFNVEVLGVMEGMLGPGRSVILVKLTGEKIEFTGVIAGMSGSPVYIDGRLVGAVAYRFGSFSREPIAGITPIDDMLAAYGDEIDPAALARTPALFRGHLPVERYRSRTLLPALPLPAANRSDAQGLQAIATPLMFSGLAPQVLAEHRAAFEASGFTPMSGGAASPGLPGLFAPRPSHERKVQSNVADEVGRVKASRIAPASAISVLLMRGDINVAAVGTVTWVQNNRVLAFGHPFVGHGSVAFPMATAAIVNTLASEAGSYKQGIPAREVGIIRQDRLTAIGGDLGEAAPMVPVRILVQRFDEPKASVGLETRVEIVDDPIWLPNMLENAISSAASRRMGYEAGGTVNVVARIHTKDRTAGFEDRISAPAPLRLAAYVARDVSTMVGMLVRNEIESAKIEGIEVLLTVTPKVQLTELERIIAPASARPGETITVQAVLRPYRGKPVKVPLTLTLPADAEKEVEIYVGGGLELDRKDGNARGRRTPKSLDDLMALLSSRRPAQALYARLYQSKAGLTQDMSIMSALPPSQRAVLSAHAPAGLEASELLPGPETIVPMNDVVAGGRSVKIRVKR